MLFIAEDAPRHETPNAVMRTLAAPSLGTDELSVWEVRMAAGGSGPRHRVDREQVWIVLAGELVVTTDDETIVASAGGALCLPADGWRTVEARTDAVAVVASAAGSHVTTPDGPRRPLPWAA